MAEKLMTRVNEEISGELYVEGLTLNPLVHFPRVAISLSNTQLYKKKKPDSLDQPVFRMEDLNLSVDILELMQSRIEITEVSISDGFLDLRKQKDGNFNLNKVIEPPIKSSSPVAPSKKKSEASPAKPKKPDEPVSDKNKTKITETQNTLELRIDKLEINGLEVIYSNETSGLKQHLHILEGEGDFNFDDHLIEGSCEIEMLLDEINLSNDLDFEEEHLELSLDLNFNQDSGELDIYQSNLVFRNAHLYTTGKIILNEDLPMDLSFEIADDELQFTRLFLTSEGVDNLKSGGLFLNGTVKGSLNDSIPNIECFFGAKNLTVEVPKTGDFVRNFKFNGSFRSGTRADFSGALLKLDALSATLPTGYVKASSEIRNFNKPMIRYDLDAQFRLENLTKIFNLDPLENLKGGISIKDQFAGTVVENMIREDIEKDDITVTLDSLSFQIPDIIDVDLLDGRITGTIDSLMIDDLQIRSGDSDLLLNGILSEFSNFAFNTDTIVKAELNINSEVFNFPKLFKALPETAEAFPYVIRDISINGGVETSQEKLENFWKVPEMDFEIREAVARVDSLLNYVRLRDGEFKMYEKDSTFFLDFNDFKLLTDDNTSEGSFQFIEQEGKRDSMNLALKTDGINLGQLLNTGKDSIPGLSDAWLGGDYQGTIILPYEEDTTAFLHRAKLEVEDFTYIAEDTISAAKFVFKTENITDVGESTESILATLEAEGDFYFQELKTPFFQDDSLGLFVNIKDGIISVSPKFYDEFGEGEDCTIKLYPYEEPPKFELDYTTNNLPLEKFLESFNSEELLKGKVDIKLDLDASGLDVKSITSSLSGSIYVVGDSLMLRGLNLDEVIRDYQKSQSFNLVDVGAVVLAGPAGIVYSKGSSYVSLLIADKNDSTEISKFSSKWSLDSGRINADDVAFATLKNRVAAKGWLDMKADSLDISIGVLNNKGCAIFNQRIYGRADKPEYSKVKFLKTLLAPVTSVVKGALGVKCEVFYDGIVTHPEEPKKKKDKS